MSILIKGMEIPENCLKCIQSGFRTAIGCTEWTKISAGRRETERALSCPVSALPDKHGDLIDRNEAYDCIAEQEGGNYVDMDTVGKGLECAPTIVEAEDEP